MFKIELTLAPKILCLFVCKLVVLGATAAFAQIDNIRVQHLRPTNLNPVFSVEDTSTRVVIQLFAGLVAYSAERGYYGDLAESWEVSEDGTVYRFTLRPNAAWSDGQEINGADVVESFELLARISDSRTLYDFSVAETKALQEGGQEIVEFTLPASSPRFLPALAYSTGAVLPIHLGSDMFSEPWTLDGIPENLPTSGPYKIENSSYDRLDLVQNPYYHSLDEVNVARVELSWLSGKSDQGTVRDIQTADVDIAHIRSAGQTEFILERMPDYIETRGTHVVDYLLLNTQAPPFDDIEVRKALTYAMAGGYPREFLELHFLTPRRSLIPVTMSEAFGDAYPYWVNQSESDLLDQAIGIMAQRGYSETNPLPFTLQLNTNRRNLRLANLAQSRWRAAFFQTTVVDRNWSDYVFEVVETGRYQVLRYGWIYDYSHPISILDTFHSSSTTYGQVYANPEFDAVVEQLRRTSDPNGIKELTDKAYDILYRDYAVIPLYGFRIGGTLLLRQPTLDLGELTFQGYPRYKNVRRLEK